MSFDRRNSRGLHVRNIHGRELKNTDRCVVSDGMIFVQSFNECGSVEEDRNMGHMNMDTLSFSSSRNSFFSCF